MPQKFLTAVSIAVVTASVASCTSDEGATIESEPGSAVTVRSDGNRYIISADAEDITADVVSDLAGDVDFRNDVAGSVSDVVTQRVAALQSEVDLLTSRFSTLSSASSALSSRLDVAEGALQENRTANADLVTRVDALDDSTAVELATIASRLDSLNTNPTRFEVKRVTQSLPLQNSVSLEDLSFEGLAIDRWYRLTVLARLGANAASADIDIIARNNGEDKLRLGFTQATDEYLARFYAGGSTNLQGEGYNGRFCGFS